MNERCIKCGHSDCCGHVTISRLADKDAEIERLRRDLAECKALLRRAVETMEYHAEQTRPIHRTKDTISAIRKWMAQDA